MHVNIDQYIKERCSVPDPNTGCILWTGSIDIWGGGYPRMWVNGRRFMVHRYLWEKEHGSTNGIHLKHICNTNACVNVAHLMLETQSQDIRKPEPILAAWMAGFFDGEGCVRIVKCRNNYHMSVSVVQNSTEPLEILRSYFGGGIRRDRNTHQYYIYSTRAYEFLKAVLPYLVVKKDQAMLAIEFQEHMRSTKGKVSGNQQYRSEVASAIHELKRTK